MLIEYNDIRIKENASEKKKNEKAKHRMKKLEEEGHDMWAWMRDNMFQLKTHFWV